MDILIKQIREAAESDNPTQRINLSISDWIRQCRERGISLMGLERLLNFYLSEDYPLLSKEWSLTGFVPEREMEINVIDLQNQIEDLKKENQRLRNELIEYRNKKRKKKWLW